MSANQVFSCCFFLCERSKRSSLRVSSNSGSNSLSAKESHTTPEDTGPVNPPPRPLEAKKVIPCERCGTVVAMLIFAPNATDPGRFEDYVRTLMPSITRV
jgi:hypothetical protein